MLHGSNYFERQPFDISLHRLSICLSQLQFIQTFPETANAKDSIVTDYSVHLTNDCFILLLLHLACTSHVPSE